MECQRVEEIGTDDQAAVDFLIRWLPLFCASNYRRGDWTVAPYALPTGLASPPSCFLAQSDQRLIYVLVTSGPIVLVHLAGLILTAVAQVSSEESVAIANPAAEVSGLVLHVGDPPQELGGVLAFLASHGMRVDALGVRLFCAGEGEVLLAVESADRSRLPAELVDVDSELEVFGDPLRVVSSFVYSEGAVKN